MKADLNYNYLYMHLYIFINSFTTFSILYINVPVSHSYIHVLNGTGYESHLFKYPFLKQFLKNMSEYDFVYLLVKIYEKLRFG